MPDKSEKAATDADSGTSITGRGRDALRVIDRQYPAANANKPGAFFDDSLTVVRPGALHSHQTGADGSGMQECTTSGY